MCPPGSGPRPLSPACRAAFGRHRRRMHTAATKIRLRCQHEPSQTLKRMHDGTCLRPKMLELFHRQAAGRAARVCAGQGQRAAKLAGHAADEGTIWHSYACAGTVCCEYRVSPPTGMTKRAAGSNKHLSNVPIPRTPGFSESHSAPGSRSSTRVTGPVCWSLEKCVLP